MIIYSDQQRKHMTPASAYMGVADFSIILGDIAKGALPTGSQMPYPLFTQEEIRNMMQEQGMIPPWENKATFDNNYMGGQYYGN